MQKWSQKESKNLLKSSLEGLRGITFRFSLKFWKEVKFWWILRSARFYRKDNKSDNEILKSESLGDVEVGPAECAGLLGVDLGRVQELGHENCAELCMRT